MTHTTPRTGQQMIDKPITVEDYEQVADEFFSKYHFVAKELGEGAKSEDILKIMENLTGLVMKKRKEEKQTSAIGFNKDE